MPDKKPKRHEQMKPMLTKEQIERAQHINAAIEDIDGLIESLPDVPPFIYIKASLRAARVALLQAFFDLVYPFEPGGDRPAVGVAPSPQELERRRRADEEARRQKAELQPQGEQEHTHEYPGGGERPPFRPAQPFRPVPRGR